MLNICTSCGAYHADQVIDPSGPFAICPECGHKQPFRWFPLLIVSGAGGSGKSTVCRALTGNLDAVVALDSDILWRPEFNKPENNYREFFEIWLRMSKNIMQSGRPVVLFGAGSGVPENIEPCIERRYFPKVHYLALTCADDVLAKRLQARPVWRQSGGESFIQSQLNFNNWFKTNHDQVNPHIDLLDTTYSSHQETLDQVTDWIRKYV